MKILRKIIAALVLLQFMGIAQATIIYEVNRVIGNGTVTGFIETDGTLGSISELQFIDWSLDMTSPDINGGVTSTSSTGDIIFNTGAMITATATDLLFDYDFNSVFGFYTSVSAWWCLAGGAGGDNGCYQSPGELMGYSDTTGNDAEYASRSGVQSFASVTTSVPEPGSLALIGIGLLGLGWAQRRTA